MNRKRFATMIAAGLTVLALAACGQDDQDTVLPGGSGAPTAAPSSAPPASATPTAAPTDAPSTEPSTQTVPEFLAGTDLPKHPTSAWFAQKVTAGHPEFGAFCVEDALKTQKTLWHRQYGTEFDTNATQVVVRLGSADEATAFMDVLAHGAALCAENWLEGFPGGTSDSKDYGAPTADTHVYGVWTSVPESEDGVHLFGIGRSGALVTVVRWGQMGNLNDAPVKAFEQTVTTAVEKLS